MIVAKLMGEQQSLPPDASLPPAPALAAPAAADEPPQLPAAASPARFDPSRMIGIIKRKALIKDLAAVYHAECLAYCQELLELQSICKEPFVDVKVAQSLHKEAKRPLKLMKKSR